MAVRIDMPKLSDTMEEGVIATWNVQEGDSVSTGDVIAEVETDKATMDVEVFDDGVVLAIVAEEGDAIPLGKAIAIIGEEGEDYEDLLDDDQETGDGKAEKTEDKKDSTSGESKDPVFGELEDDSSADTDGASKGEGGRIKASPLARNMAEDKGIDLANVNGSGPDGRIIKRKAKTGCSACCGHSSGDRQRR